MNQTLINVLDNIPLFKFNFDEISFSVYLAWLPAKTI